MIDKIDWYLVRHGMSHPPIWMMWVAIGWTFGNIIWSLVKRKK